MSYMTCGFGSIDPTSPKGAAKPTDYSLGPTASPLPPNTEYDEPRRSCFMLFQWIMRASVGWATRPPPPWWGVAPGPPLIV